MATVKIQMSRMQKFILNFVLGMDCGIYKI